jgi:hypothetical protein
METAGVLALVYGKVIKKLKFLFTCGSPLLVVHRSVETEGISFADCTTDQHFIVKCNSRRFVLFALIKRNSV